MLWTFPSSLRDLCTKWLGKWSSCIGERCNELFPAKPLNCFFCPSSEEIQLQRLMQRDSSTREDALSRLRSQMPIADKVAYADVVLDNSGTHQDLEAQVDDLLRRLDKEVGWTWRISWLFPPFAIASAALLLLWRTIKRRRRSQRRKRG